MGMDWLKGLVAPPAQLIPPGQPVPSGLPTPSQESPTSQTLPSAGALPSDEARITALEARCDKLEGDLECVGLFARTLLALLEEKQIVTEEQFQAARKKLDERSG